MGRMRGICFYNCFALCFVLLCKLSSTDPAEVNSVYTKTTCSQLSAEAWPIIWLPQTITLWRTPRAMGSRSFVLTLFIIERIHELPWAPSSWSLYQDPPPRVTCYLSHVECKVYFFLSFFFFFFKQSVEFIQ